MTVPGKGILGSTMKYKITLLLTALLASASASAEMYKCVRPDGAVVHSNLPCRAGDSVITIDGIPAAEARRLEVERRAGAERRDEEEKAKARGTTEHRSQTYRRDSLDARVPSGGIGDTERNNSRQAELERKRDVWFSWDSSTKIRTVERMMESTKSGGYSPRLSAANYVAEINRVLARGASITVPEAFALLMTAEDLQRR